MSENFLRVNPILPVKSVRETANFYKQKLGFTISLLWENPAYGAVKRENVTIEFGEGRKQYMDSGVCIIIADNADAIYEEWKSRDVEFVGDFADRDYGSKDFRVKDNNGNILIVSHPLENQKALIQKGNLA